MGGSRRWYESSCMSCFINAEALHSCTHAAGISSTCLSKGLLRGKGEIFLAEVRTGSFTLFRNHRFLFTVVFTVLVHRFASVQLHDFIRTPCTVSGTRSATLLSL